MNAFVLDYTARSLVGRDTPEPKPRDGEVRLLIRAGGICGTDRDLARFRFGEPPPGSDYMILGHEALAQVEYTGEWVVPMVRRPCAPACFNCGRDRRDLCLSGRYAERGILGAHGYFAEMAVDQPRDLVHVPDSLAEFAILVEPMSVVEKAIAIVRTLAQRPVETVLVLGAGTIGLLAAAVALRFARRVVVQSIEPRDHHRARLVERLGAEYNSECVADAAIEAAGATEAADRAVRSLSRLGVAVLLGGPAGDVRVPMRDAVLKNLTIAGSVNADPASFRAAVEDLAGIDRAVLDAMIERRHFRHLAASMEGPLPDAPKVVHLWS